MDEITTAMRADRKELTRDLKNTFKDVRPLRSTIKRPTPKQELAAFMGMTQTEREQLAMEIGPEEYSNFVMGKMNQLVQSLGPAAQSLQPYLLAPIQALESGEVDRDTLESEVMAMLGEE